VTSQSTTSPRKVSAWLDLPLLRRELVESAKRRRLWIVRGCLAAAQTLFVIFNYDDLMGLPGGLGAFGGGQEIAAVINVCNMVAIYLLLPLTACAAIASERERQTLPLLLISRISPARMVFEKFLSSLIPVLTMMSISLPSLALAYSLGGLSPLQLTHSIAAMLVAAVQVNTAAIFWSAVFRTSLQAFWGTLFTLLAYAVGPGILGLLVQGRFYGRLFGFSVEVYSIFVGFWELPWLVSTGQAIPLVLPPLVAGSVLLLATMFVVSRYRCEAPLSQLPRLSHFPRLLKLLRITGEPLPGCSAPTDFVPQDEEATPSMRVPSESVIAWRECMIAGGYRARLFGLLVLFMPAAFWILTRSDLNFESHEACVTLNIIALIAGVLVVQGVGTRSFSLERDRETLAVLLTTPLSTREIVTQKIAAASRARLLFMPAFAMLSTISLWHTEDYQWQMQADLPRWTVEPVSLVLIWQHLTLAMWVAVAWSIRSGTTLKCAAGTLSTLFGYCLIHFFLLFYVLEITDANLDYLLPALPLIAWIAVVVDQFPVAPEVAGWQCIACLFLSPVLLGGLLAGLRYATLRNAGKWLSRE
jgi:hypothetical protein